MSEAVAAVAPVGLVLGRYRPLQPLGSGGSGSVWLARDEGSGVDVALKIVSREGKGASRAEREGSAAARLRHPHCLRSYALARDERHVYIAYEYVPGKTFRDALRAGELDDRAAVEAGAQICEAIAHAHSHGIVHRDVKPSNVLLADGPEISVRLFDFGLALMEDEETLTAAGDVPGTLAYIPPERLRGDCAGPAGDVWAAGVLLWESLAGVHPFWNGSLLDTARRIESGAASLGRARPDLPKALIALVDRALSLDPARRPSAAKLAAGLRNAYRERERKRRRRPLAPPRAEQLAPAAAAALFAGWTAWKLSFFPHGFALGLAGLAAALTLVRPRLGLAFALAVPILPLGNVSLGLATLYSALAAGWLALSWREPNVGLFCATGPLLAPIAALGLLPLAAQAVRGHARRAVQVAAAVLLAALAAAIRDVPLPFSGAPAPRVAGLSANEHPTAVAAALWHALQSRPALLTQAIMLAGAALLLPLARRRGPWGIAIFGATIVCAAVLPSPSVSALPLVLATWFTCGWLIWRDRAAGAPEPAS
ncbi:MAG: serine/threonine protein kinase [Actinomycetota bacterium]|nr:serine/threonine protein kinase [Actinomycetota bacterium]